MYRWGGGKPFWGLAEACELSCVLRSNFLTNCLNLELKSSRPLKGANDLEQVANLRFPLGPNSRLWGDFSVNPPSS